MSQLDEALGRLESSSAVLVRVVKDTVPSIRMALDPKTKLMEGCPSHQSAADLNFRDIEVKFREVEGAVKDVKRAIWNKP